jgi:tetratricopeptide (TPR) repeat protein
MSGDMAAVVARGAALVADAQQHLGADATFTLNVRAQWAQALARVGRFADALAQQREVVRYVDVSKALNEENRAHHRGVLGNLLSATGQHDEALPLLRANLAYYDEKAPQSQMARVTRRLWLAAALLRADRAAEALAAYERTAAELAAAPATAAHPRRADALQGQALALRRLGRASEAAAPLSQACGIFANAKALAANDERRCLAHRAWLAAEAAPGDAAALAAWESASAAYVALLLPEHVARADVQLLQAGLLRAAGRGDEAQALRTAGERAWQQAIGRPVMGPVLLLH